MSSPLRFFEPLGDFANRSTGFALSGYIQKLDKRLLALGEPDGIHAKGILGVQVFCAITFPIFWTYIIRFMNLAEGLFNGPVQLLVYIAFICMGFYFPVMNLKEKIGKRQKKIILALPDVMDLLTISVEAGLDFMTALQRVVEKQLPGPLRDELSRVFKQIELGKARRDALKELADRIQISDVSNVCSALVQADRLGSSLGPILRAQSDMLRIRRGQRAEKAALEAPVKMLAPLLMCIFPSVFIMIFAPLFIKMMIDLGRF
jgi:tight adherence protein C